MIKKLKILTLVISTLLLSASFSFAADTKLPEVMVGQTKVSQYSKIGSINLSATSSVEVSQDIAGLGDKPFTVTAWIKPTASTAQYQTIIGKGRVVSSNNTVGWALGLSRNTDAMGKPIYLVQVSAGTTAKTVISRTDTFSESVLYDGNWHFLAFSYDPTSSTPIGIQFDSTYKNPYSAGSVIGQVSNSSAKTIIGSSSNGFIGLVDEVRIYDNIAFSANDMLQASNIANAAANLVNPNSLRARWSFNSMPGGATVADDSGNGFTGTVKSGAAWNADISAIKMDYWGGLTGNEAVYNYNAMTGRTIGKQQAPSLKFNGSDSYILVPHSTSLNPSFTGTSGTITVAAWVKPTEYPPAGNTGGIVSKIDSALSNGYSLGLMPDGKVKFTINGGTAVTSNEILPKNSWSLVVGIIDSANLNVSVNANASTSASRVGKSVYPTSNLLIGAFDAGSQKQFFNGLIDEVSVFRRVLSGQEIKDWYSQGVLSGSVPSAHWSFSETSGSAFDSVPSGLIGTLQGGISREAGDGPTLRDSSAQDELFGFNKYALIRCLNGVIIGTAEPYERCFLPNSTNSGIKVMTSQTFVNGVPGTETAVLFYPPKIAVGDVYGSLNNFAFWGRSIHEQATGNPESDASWKLGNYPINTNAQAAWNGTEFQKNSAKITQLKNEAPLLNSSDTGSRSSGWYLQSETDSGSSYLDDVSNKDNLKYPEGKIWRINGDLAISGNVPYYGKGTIIVDGNLTVGANAKIFANNSTARLGIIVLGSINFGGSNSVQAEVYCPDTLTTGGGNNEFVGSFVANDFVVNSANARFYYDYALDESWPPGFRFLNMPHPAEVKQ